ncbi:MAG TPA: (2Fe-2S) ferredoxin domain-containing protein [Actinospica sp.]|nr:(2Fe-2S) ferredoxin domain-containing protein [Actinospica sp.]
MAKGKKPEKQRAEPRATVTVCRGCCCGRVEKNPGIDHAGQLAALRERLGRARVRVSDCLDVCEQSNVIVVSPAPAGRAQGARPVWFGLVNDAEAVTDVAAWVEAGGPGLAPAPEILDLYRFTPSRRVRAESGIDQ